MSLNVKQRVVIFTTIIIFITTIISFFISQKFILDLVYKRFQEKLNFMAKHLASSAAFGILLGNKSILNNIANSILKDKDVIGVIIEDKYHNILYKKGRTSTKFVILPVKLSTYQENYIFSGEIKDNSLGSIKVYYTTSNLKSLINKLFIHSITMAFIISLFMGILVYFLVIYSFVRPFHELLLAVDRVSKGELTFTLSSKKGMPETRQLAQAFGEMVKSLKKSQELLKNTYEKMAIQKSLAEIGKMSLVVAHEVKNPLGIIKGCIDIIKKKEVDNTTKDQMISYIEEEIKRLDDFIKEFMDISKAKRPELKEINVRNFIENLKQKVYMQYPDKEICFSVPEDKLIVFDQMLMEKVFINLIKNSYEANATKVFISIEKQDEFWKISIADNGDGISDEDKKHIFEPFYTTKDKGSGFGMVFVSQAISAMKGKIEIKDNTPKGNIFEIYIPVNLKLNNQE